MDEITIPFHGGKLVVSHEEATRAWLEKVFGADATHPAAAVAVPRIGEYWEGQGGIYVGVMPTESGRFAHRIVSVDEAESLAYGGHGHSTPDASSKLDGSVNTRSLLSAAVGHPAAKWCAKYTKDGHTDFYLPAQRELSLAWATSANVFAAAWYWSSTQYNAYNAWLQLFSDGCQDFSIKGNGGRVRAFRRVEIQ